MSVRKSEICGSDDYNVNGDICNGDIGNDNDDAVGTPVHQSGLPTSALFHYTTMPTLFHLVLPPVVDHTHPSDHITGTRRTLQMESTFANNTHSPVTSSAV